LKQFKEFHNLDYRNISTLPDGIALRFGLTASVMILDNNQTSQKNKEIK